MGVPNTVLVLDGGHNIIKGKTASAEQTFPHAVHGLRMSEYEEIVMRAGKNLSDDYLLINGNPYVVGESAEHHDVINRRIGPERYTSDYYGVFVAAMLYRLYKTNCSVALFASHPTGDIRYREDLARAAWGEWSIEHGDEKRKYCIEYVNTFEEALGGLYNVILADSGVHYARSEVNEGRVLVIDIGGGTTDLQSVTDGQVSFDIAHSIDIGIQKVEADFESGLRANNPARFKNVRHIDRSMLREAIKTGVFTGGGSALTCTLEIRGAIKKLLNQLKDAYTTIAKGPANWHHIILTGGGSSMLYTHLLPVLEHGSIILAENNPAEMHLANVRGGMKMWKMWRSQGWL